MDANWIGDYTFDPATSGSPSLETFPAKTVSNNIAAYAGEFPGRTSAVALTSDLNIITSAIGVGKQGDVKLPAPTHNGHIVTVVNDADRDMHVWTHADTHAIELRSDFADLRTTTNYYPMHYGCANDFAWVGNKWCRLRTSTLMFERINASNIGTDWGHSGAAIGVLPTPTGANTLSTTSWLPESSRAGTIGLHSSLRRASAGSSSFTIRTISVTGGLSDVMYEQNISGLDRETWCPGLEVVLHTDGTFGLDGNSNAPTEYRFGVQWHTAET